MQGRVSALISIMQSLIRSISSANRLEASTPVLSDATCLTLCSCAKQGFVNGVKVQLFRHVDLKRRAVARLSEWQVAWRKVANVVV